MIIAIDGPAASGKSTTAKLLAEKIHFIHLNSGLMYRAITYIIIKNNLLEDFSSSMKFLFENLKFKGKHLNIVFFKGKNISDKLYSEKINKNINFVSNNIIIRKKLIQFQRSLVKNKNVVCEGRDIGSVVFPDAEFKFYLNASIDERADRRYKEVLKTNSNISKEEIINNIIVRDSNDINRKNSPLMKVKDCIELDTTRLTINQQVEYIYSIIKNRK